MITNKSIMHKANMEVADLIADGGYLREEQANSFIINIIQEAVVLKLIQVQALKSHTKLLDKVGIEGFVLHPGTSGAALAAADRVKPVTSQNTLETALMKGEISLSDELLEDNIESGTFKQTVMKIMAEHVALDMDKVAVNGDKSGTTGTVLDLIDGMIVSATDHVVNGGNVTINKGMLRNCIKAMPSEYNRMRAKQRFLTSEDADTDYRDYLSDRSTVLGDKFLEGNAPVMYGGRSILPIPVFPDNLGPGLNTTNILMLDPKNAVWGVWRKVKVETDRDIRSGEWIMVTTVRAGFSYIEKDAVVKVTNVVTQ